MSQREALELLLVNRFLTWSLPQTVNSDRCVTDNTYQFPRMGTNLLSADEAHQMVKHLLDGFTVNPIGERVIEAEAIFKLTQTGELPSEDVSARVAKVNEDVIVPTKAAVVDTITTALTSSTKELIAQAPVANCKVVPMHISVTLANADKSMHNYNEETLSVDGSLAKALAKYPDAESADVFIMFNK
jgi:hypothetical protein